MTQTVFGKIAIGILAFTTLGALNASGQSSRPFPSPLDLEALENRFEEANSRFFSASAEDLLRRFSDLTSDLTAYEATSEESERIDRLLVGSLAFRTRLNFNLDRQYAVTDDLVRILEIEPSFHFDSTQVTPSLIERLDKLRKVLVGYLRLEVDPSDAEVRLDGRPIDPAVGPVAFARDSGKWTLEISAERPGFRSVTWRLDTYSTDQFHRIVMERDAAAVKIETEPPGATVAIDGGTFGQRIGTTPLWVSVRPGDYTAEISKPGFRILHWRLPLHEPRDYFYSESLEREAVPVMSTRSAGIALVGILGGDRLAAEELRQRLRAASAHLRGWTLLDHSKANVEMFRDLGIDADLLRSAAESGRLLGSGIDWEELQARTASSDHRVAVVVLAVLSDDLMASAADLWFLPSPPGPAFPDYRRIHLRDQTSLGAVLSDLDRPIELERIFSGVLLLDSDAVEGPVVADVDPGSAAADAGIEVGDELLSISGKRVRLAREVPRLIEAAAHESDVGIRVRRSGEERSLQIDARTSPTVIRHNSSNLIYAAIASKLSSLSAEPAIPQWLKQLNLGKVYLNSGAWEEALREFRTANGLPSGPGLGQAAADYWLGVALQAIGPDYYGQARAAFQRAAAVEGARLYHNDGPLIVSRARARLAELGPGLSQ